jgi:hypothetical protein
VSFLQCPECQLTVSSAAYFLRGDECPRCMTAMEKRPTFRPAAAPVTAPMTPSVVPAPAEPSTA